MMTVAAKNNWAFGCRHGAAAVLALLAAAVYLLAFSLAAVDWGGGYYFLGSRLNGYEAFESAWRFPPLWLANPCSWFGIGALALGKWRTAAGSAVAGCLSGLTVVPLVVGLWFENGRARFEAGFYVWLASFAATFAGAFVIGLLSPREHVSGSGHRRRC